MVAIVECKGSAYLADKERKEFEGSVQGFFYYHALYFGYAAF